MDSLIFRTLTSRDEPQFRAGLELLNRTQGRDLFGPTYLSEKTSDPKALVVAALDGGQIVGLGVSELLSSFDYYLPFNRTLASELQHKRVGSFSTLCVVETLQGKGIGQRLSRMRLDWLREQKREVILGVSWVSGLDHTSDRVFEKMGFKAVGRVHDFYRESSLKTPFDCPGCEDAPCRCSAILYRLDW